jgi:hypothetical protein
MMNIREQIEAGVYTLDGVINNEQRRYGFVMNLVDAMRNDHDIATLNFDMGWMIRLAQHTLTTNQHRGLDAVVTVYESILRV